MSFVRWALVFLVPFQTPVRAQGNTYTFYPNLVTVRGRLVQLREQAASGGTVMVLAIRLDADIVVKPSPNSRDKDIDAGTYSHVRVVQVFFPGVLGDKKARKMLGHLIIVRCTCSERIAPGQFTDVTMDVKSYSADPLSVESMVDSYRVKPHTVASEDGKALYDEHRSACQRAAPFDGNPNV